MLGIIIIIIIILIFRYEEILSEEQFECNGVRSTLEWAEGNSTYSYHTDIAPYLPFFSFSSTFITFKIPYNTAYNVSVLATTSNPCLRNVTHFFEVHYGELNHMK